ncbi:hypothetical protein [Macrococcus capreoli]|uniref:hypothetical protein n=1 Tax=Macrococcus capreoli TaxID=2982690 RepID=UPI0021D5EA7C|nr:hypothetical protein [Macrococcus sp. TMW 2.2395]MCU7556949.1 hypothetical protein [Macrococcus sp. TMW 2.2395]
MNEEEKVSLLIDERTELIPHEMVYDTEVIAQHTDEDRVDALQHERMTTEEILREIAEEEELEAEFNNALEEVKLYKYIVNTIEYHEGDAITLQQLRNIAAHQESKLTIETLDELLNDYVEAGYLRIEEDKLFTTFLGQHAMTLL